MMGETNDLCTLQFAEGELRRKKLSKDQNKKRKDMDWNSRVNLVIGEHVHRHNDSTL